MEIWTEPDTGDDSENWLDLGRLADPDSVERLELWLQVRELDGGRHAE